MHIIQDTRERDPWNFIPYGCNQTICKLEEGDYTIKGYEHLLRVERKRNTGELAINLGKKKKQFFAELKRLQKYQFKYIVCEFDLHDIFSFPENSGIPRHEWSKLRITSNYISACIDKIVTDCDIQFLFCRNKSDAERKFIEIYNEIRQVRKK